MPSSPYHTAAHLQGASSSALTSSGRTYDAKLVQREMLRLGTLAHQLPSAALSTVHNSASAASAALASASAHILPTSNSTATVIPSVSSTIGHAHGGAASISMGMTGNDGAAWAQLHVHVLPLFNHEQLQPPIEDLNALVQRHIKAVVSFPSRALATLENDAAELINSGMITLNTKLTGVEDDKLVLLPLQTSEVLIGLYRTPKSHRPSSPTQESAQMVTSTPCSPIDVRTIALRAFRDKIIVPVAPRLEARLLAMFRREGPVVGSASNGSSLGTEATGYQPPRLQQM
ncbi:hypothetical protein EW145_g7763 [Phellinidium pouzarii]|uniref:Uncharacterized protein n=1 Tax=Phellinidium pouzarii TaxID=167371 RepID=A0A4S4KEG1_9AGAM|nr:hypothetical protein EW145_g7763 [Phellinidium pouzarii]